MKKRREEAQEDTQVSDALHNLGDANQKLVTSPANRHPLAPFGETPPSQQRLRHQRKH